MTSEKVSRRGFFEWAGRNALAVGIIAGGKPLEMTMNYLANLGAPTPEEIKFIAENQIIHGSFENKTIAMTYDEGLNAGNVSSLLDTYKKLKVPCTFFMTGEGLNQSKDLLPRIIDEGHVIGCHSFDHVNLRQLSDNQKKEQFQRWLDRLHTYLPSYVPEYFRAPYGSTDQSVFNVAASFGLQHVLWGVESGGQDSNTKTYVEKNLKTYQVYYKNQERLAMPREDVGGAIVLSHTHRGYDISQAEEIVSSLKNNGFKLVTVPDIRDESQIYKPQK